MKTYEFKLTVCGTGDDVDGAFRDAMEALICDWGPTPSSGDCVLLDDDEKEAEDMRQKMANMGYNDMFATRDTLEEAIEHSNMMAKALTSSIEGIDTAHVALNKIHEAFEILDENRSQYMELVQEAFELVETMPQEDKIGLFTAVHVLLNTKIKIFINDKITLKK